MTGKDNQKAVLILQDGTIMEGIGIGKKGTTAGEICFNTGMTGYQEIYTDPSYFGQIIINTTAHIGNYGAHKDEVESDSIKFAGLICNEFSEIKSRQSTDIDLDGYLSDSGIVGIANVDTRGLVRHIRSKGAMNCIISSENLALENLKKQLKEVPSMEGLELSSKVSTESTYELGNQKAKYRVAVLDLGIKTNILRQLAERDCYLKVFPFNTSIEEMESFNPHGYFISNGPGDPASTKYAVEIVKLILKKEKPLFGICLGHQILALANGLETFKMHHGHRGLNHPVKNLNTGKSEITSQNHGFNVAPFDEKKFPDVQVTHINLNDQTIEGIRIKNKPAFSVQYHPESSPGPHDSRYLFDDFIQLMKN
ncbi:glutamine-hydrolyzing carbamoyl-phosphate synthase small subunit [Hyphobacterium sp. CCMP332]|nr:glutamine-hydrolyzing carbamoyl-phosphate synthase small subunit [Hyphobacterium sp. CCMP332]